MTTQSREESAFKSHYSELYSLTDIDNLLPHFVEENIITESKLNEMKSLTSYVKKNRLLSQISGRLKTGNTKGFYAMLSIMKKHGTETTRNLSSTIMSTLKTEYADEKESNRDTVSKQDSPVLTPDPLSVHFSNFVASVEECLEKCPNKLDACKRICSNLTISGSDSLLFNNQQLAEINDCASFRQLFTLLRQHWNWKEYSILKTIIEISESDEGKAHLEKYQKRAAFTRSFSEPTTAQTSVDDEEEVDLQNKAARRSHRHSIKIEDKRCENCIEEDPVVAYCPDCHLALCSVCTTSHKRDKRFHNHSILTLTELRSKKAASKDMALFCKEHDYELKQYCETCEQLVCLYCTQKEHNGHNHNTIKMMAEKHKNQIKETIAPVEKMMKDLSEACNKVDKIGSDIEKQGKEVDMEIDKHYHELIEKLKAQKEEMKQQAHDIISQKKKAIATQLKEMKQVQADLESMKKLRDSLEDQSDQDTLSTKKQVINRMQQLTIQYKKLNTNPVELPSVTFLPTKRPLPKSGKVFAFVDPEASEVVQLPRFTFKRTKVEFTIITKYSNGSQYPHGGNRVSVELETSTGEAATVHVTDNNDGSYTASFVAQQLGSLDLSISINGKHIKGSPYTVMVGRNYPAIDKPSRIIDNNGKMGVPWGVAFGNHGIWAVADYSNHCIYVFNAQDQLIKRFGSKGTNTGQFQSPGGVVFDEDNHIYVADHYNNRIQKFDVNGNFLLQFGNQRSGEGQLNCPVAVAAHKGKLYVAEEHSDHISVFLMNGQFCTTIGEGHLSGSFDVAINVNDQLLVADCGHNCIFTFGLGGHYIGKFGPRGTGRGQLSNPRSVITDPNGFIFVAEFGNHRISIFDQTGNFMHCFGSRGSLEGQFQSPLGIALSPNGSIFVSDGYEKRGRIQIFSTF